MKLEFDLSFRRLFNLTPRWVRVTLVGSLFLGICMEVFCTKLFRPFFEANTKGFLEPDRLGQLDWLLVGAAIAFPVAWLRRTATGGQREQSAEARTEAYIAAMKRAMDEAELEPTQRKFIWRSVFKKMADDFKVGANPPKPSEVVEAIKIAGPDSPA